MSFVLESLRHASGQKGREAHFLIHSAVRREPSDSGHTRHEFRSVDFARVLR